MICASFPIPLCLLFVPYKVQNRSLFPKSGKRLKFQGDVPALSSCHLVDAIFDRLHLRQKLLALPDHNRRSQEQHPSTTFVKMTDLSGQSLFPFCFPRTMICDKKTSLHSFGYHRVSSCTHQQQLATRRQWRFESMKKAGCKPLIVWKVCQLPCVCPYYSSMPSFANC